MATVPGTNYPSQTDVDATNYPQGKARNVSVTGDGTGTPFDKEWVNDLFGMWQALLADAGLTPSGVSDTAVASQYLDAIKQACPNRITQRAMTAEAGIISQTVTATGPSTPSGLTHGAFSTASPLAIGDVVDISFGPLDIVNGNSTGNDAFLVIQTSQNGAGLGTTYSYRVPVNRTMTFSPRVQFTCNTAGAFVCALALLNDNSNGVVVKSLEQGNFVFSYIVIRP